MADTLIACYATQEILSFSNQALPYPCAHCANNFHRDVTPAGGGAGALSDLGLAAASSLPPLTQLADTEKDWLEVLTTTDRFFQVREAKNPNVLKPRELVCNVG